MTLKSLRKRSRRKRSRRKRSRRRTRNMRGGMQKCPLQHYRPRRRPLAPSGPSEIERALIRGEPPPPPPPDASDEYLDEYLAAHAAHAALAKEEAAAARRMLPRLNELTQRRMARVQKRASSRVRRGPPGSRRWKRARARGGISRGDEEEPAWFKLFKERYSNSLRPAREKRARARGGISRRMRNRCG
jgi:hypothetical protein